MIRDTYLVMVTENNNNKFYNMFPSPDQQSFTVKYGRVGQDGTTTSYPISKWYAKYNSKVRKGYVDQTENMIVSTTDVCDSGNKAFDNFYDMISSYTGKMSKSIYAIDKCSPQQIKDGQAIINRIVKAASVQEANDLLLQLYALIPRQMRRVNDHLLDNMESLNQFVKNEQDALDSMESTSIIANSINPYSELGIGMFEEVDAGSLRDKINRTIGAYNQGYKIKAIYQCHNQKRKAAFDDFLSNQKHQNCELLFHGTKNANVISIMKSGLLIRPSNAVSYAGSNYGDGVYHSSHTAKSLNYCGHDRDAIFFVQNVNMGNFYTYNGWRRKGKDVFNLDLENLKSRGYDSCYVEPGDGLLNSEYIVYDHRQTVCNYLVHFQR